ncbi:cation channel sperm-associated protein subunit delta-like [Polypterus senegalus]|uniref:cation channel sperm-associated protein subunit delta-like n=1 Tax=Polypterus senegalus TaxID=55291 RepID=UPI001963EC52|nr:cation channel sperm-associated protein subunit delta-like [Polypterus senegalus]
MILVKFAILLRNKLVIYGHISLNPDTIQLQDQPDIQDGSVIMFTPSRDLLIIKAISSPVDNVVDFLHCPIIIDQSIGKGNASDVCLIDDLESDFYGSTLYVDKTRSFLLTMNFVSRLSTDLIPLVALTNPQVLKANTAMEKDFKSEDGMHYSFKINVSLEQDEKKKDPSLYNSTIVGSFVTLTSDFKEKDIRCRNSYPQYVQFSIGCPPSKYIRISSNFTVCEKDLFSPYQLANNFTYTISKNVYDPEFLSRSGSATEDLSVYYNYTKYGCPILVNSKIPWIPLLELWEDDKFVEYVPADFVLFETHGMFNFGYLKTVGTSQCVTQPQNWMEMLNRQVFPNPNTAWTRKNYRNCRNTNGPPITHPDVHYEVLKKDYWNKVKFPKYNGILIFKAIVVDPDYSFCSLNTTFSVYVIRTAYRENRIQSSKIRYLLGPSFVGFYLFLFVVWRIMKMIQNKCL